MNLDGHDRKPRVLVVDDDESIRELITFALEDEGFHVDCAPEGETALEMVSEVQPDVILLDNRMPVMDGQGFVDRYRERYGHDTPLIILTAIDDPASVAEEIGVEGYLSKPFDLSDLTRVVNQHIPQKG